MIVVIKRKRLSPSLAAKARFAVKYKLIYKCETYKFLYLY
jgi:hypothetical protein